MAEIKGLLATDVAKTIIEVMQWEKTATSRWFGPRQERIEIPGDQRWIGVTSSLLSKWVSLHAGRIDGEEFLSPEVHSKRVDGTDQAALALATRQVWEELDRQDAAKKRP
ncbi:hypothetical protein [Streptomyces phytophilus]|uniref:hypothetical protein n=1 Tax=Streptomyces phytophilus TaxID=722715 RepID=UPI0015EFF9DF|nr:hypothetical protein [Streptomyces phytophilus]